MENLVFTQLSIPEIKQLFRQELQTYFESKPSTAQQPEADQLLTIQQAAELLKLSVPTLYGLVGRSAIPVSKKTKRLYFSKQDLFLWVKEGRRKTVSEIEAEADCFLQTKQKGGSKTWMLSNANTIRKEKQTEAANYTTTQ